MQPLPIQYHLEVYEGTLGNDPSFSIETTTPLPAISVGDFYNHRTFDGWSKRPNTENEVFRVKEVEHIIWTIDNSHVGYKMMVCLEVITRVW